MNRLQDMLLKRANEEMIFCLYIKLAHKADAAAGDSLAAAVEALRIAAKADRPRPWKERDKTQLAVLYRAIKTMPHLAVVTIGDLTRSVNGLSACSLTKPDGSISVVFRGTGYGEWIDNGEGLSGIPEENNYLTFGDDGTVTGLYTVNKDYATDQQVEALNWFRGVAAKNGWDDTTDLTLSGHSKGGNKAQFVTVHSPFVRRCFSFDGQGFSPEALTALSYRIGASFDERRRRIYSLSADNDYVNVLGERLMPKSQVCFVQSRGGLHYPEAMLDENGVFHPFCEQGTLSRYVESVSGKLMSMKPWLRQHATLGVMNVLQTYLGKGIPVNGDAVSLEQTVAGMAVAVGVLLGGTQ